MALTYCKTLLFENTQLPAINNCKRLTKYAFYLFIWAFNLDSIKITIVNHEPYIYIYMCEKLKSRSLIRKRSA